MIAFLEEVARDILNKYPKGENISIIFQNKRAGLFFRKYYASTIGEVSWAPDIYTIDKILNRLTRLHTADEFSLLFDLHETYTEVFAHDETEQQITFDRFYHMGQMILTDFNDLDSALVDIDRLFANIKDLEGAQGIIDSFTDEQKEVLRNFHKHFEAETLSIEKEKYLRLWTKIPELYRRFREKLLANKAVYQGLMYRYLAELIDSNSLAPQHSRLIFVGFNALSPVEEKLFAYYRNKELANFYWDTDIYYQLDDKQEAGTSQRKNMNTISQGELGRIPDNFNNANKNVQLIGVPLEVGQAKILPRLLAEFGTAEQYSRNTAIVLADEHLLFPVLNALPPDVDKINITMGYPLRGSRLFDLVEKYLKATISFIDSGRTTIPAKEILALIQHPEVVHKAKAEPGEIEQKINANKAGHLSPSELPKTNNTLLELLLQQAENTTQLLEHLLDMLFLLYEGKTEESATIEGEFIYQAYISIKRLKEIIETKDIKLPLKGAIKILLQILGKQRVPFSGEPLEGLQIMGMLETRNIDFENVIVLSLNEGIFPMSTRPATLISEYFRTAFGMTSTKKRDEVSAYLFYRLLQRAQNIRLVYNNIVGNNSKEISRFVQQIQHESALNITIGQLIQNVKTTGRREIRIEKNDETVAILQRYILPQNIVDAEQYTDTEHKGRSFSASAINTYIDCKLKFYFKYIAAIKEKQTIDSEINPMLFGNLLHKTMELLYKQQIARKGSRNITASDIEAMRADIDTQLSAAFVFEFSEGKNATEGQPFEFRGSQIIIRDVIKRHLHELLNFDKKHAPFEIVALETDRNYPSMLNVAANNQIFAVALSGTLDRLDKKAERYRIVDYKTGSAKRDFREIASLFDPAETDRRKAVMQMFYYAFLFEQSNKTAPLPDLALFSVRELYDSDYDPGLHQKIERKRIAVDSNNIDELLDEYKGYLSDTIGELYNREVPFEQTHNAAICEYCPYTNICAIK